jgi:hypothetical protein
MTEANTTSKRRRLDEAASTLSRPFKSPLRSAANQLHANTDEEKHPAEGKAGHAHSLLQSEPPNLLGNSAKRPRSPPQPDAALTSLQKQKITLQSRLARLRSELDTAQQALRIESSPRDEELRSLISKWRTVSQGAADELFPSAQERITRMGGVAAWRGRENENQRRSGWDGDGEEGDHSAPGGTGHEGSQTLESSGTGDRTRLQEHDEDEVVCRLLLILSALLIGFALPSFLDVYHGHDAQESESRT